MSPNFWRLREICCSLLQLSELFACEVAKYAQQLKLKQDSTQDMFRYIFRRIPPTSHKKKKIYIYIYIYISNIKRKKVSFLSPEVPAYRVDKYKCLTKNSRHDLLFITDVRWPFQNAIDRFVINASFFRSSPNGHKLTNSTIWSQRDRLMHFVFTNIVY